MCIACGTPLLTTQQNVNISNQDYGIESVQQNALPVKQFGAYSENIAGLPTSYNNSLYGHVSKQQIGISGVSLPGTHQAVSGKGSGKWECTYCTFHNDLNTNICGMCAKSTDNPVELPSDNTSSPLINSPGNLNPFITTSTYQPQTNLAYRQSEHSPYSSHQTGGLFTSPHTITSVASSPRTPSMSSEDVALSPYIQVLEPEVIEP